MGKIRVKTIGAPELEEEEKRKSKKKKEEKKLAKAPGMKGGERVVSVGPSEEELAKIPVREEENIASSQVKKATTSSPKFAKREKKRSKKYNELVVEINKNKKYPLDGALSLLRKVKLSKFDETVELHINTTEAGISGTLKLPHGTGKEIKVAIADDSLLQEIEKGKVNFDVLIASPDMMPSLAKVARILGPRGLMPNPKNGTISQDPASALKKFQSGQISFKTENKIPVIHLSVGKTSFGDEKLKENITTVISTIKKDRIKNATLTSTMSPGIKLAL